MHGPLDWLDWRPIDEKPSEEAVAIKPPRDNARRRAAPRPRDFSHDHHRTALSIVAGRDENNSESSSPFSELPLPLSYPPFCVISLTVSDQHSPTSAFTGVASLVFLFFSISHLHRNTYRFFVQSWNYYTRVEWKSWAKVSFVRKFRWTSRMEFGEVYLRFAMLQGWNSGRLKVWQFEEMRGRGELAKK